MEQIRIVLKPEDKIAIEKAAMEAGFTRKKGEKTVGQVGTYLRELGLGRITHSGRKRGK